MSSVVQIVLLNQTDVWESYQASIQMMHSSCSSAFSHFPQALGSRGHYQAIAVSEDKRLSSA